MPTPVAADRALPCPPGLLAPGSLLIYCDGGLANRVNSLLGGLALATRLDRTPRVLWPRNNRCGAAFGEVFEMPLEVHETRLQDLVPHERHLVLWLHENDIGFGAPVTRLRDLPADRAAALLTTASAADARAALFCENSVLPWLDAAEVQGAIDRLAFRPAIVDEARRLIARHAPGGYVGVHLRGTDFHTPPPTEQMFALAQQNPRAPFFVCSDDAAIEARFGTLPNVFLHPKTAWVGKLADGPWRGAVLDSDGLPYTSNIDRGAHSVVQACVDLLLLAGSQPVQTSASSFLALALRLRESGWVARHLPPWVEPPAITSQQEIVAVLELLRPYHLLSDHKVRIGADGDGGYVMPSMARRSTAVLSLGIGDQTSFDAELADLGATVLQYDHTIDGPPQQHPNFRFHRLGWGPRDEGPLRSLATMMQGIDWRQARHAILKFDTEGAEWEALAAVDPALLERFDIIAGEFHGFHQLVHREAHDRIKGVIEKLRRSHLPVHLHANNATGIRLVQGVPVPPLLEITFVRRAAAVFAGHSNEPIPGPLDRPNMADRPDICLRPF